MREAKIIATSLFYLIGMVGITWAITSWIFWETDPGAWPAVGRYVTGMLMSFGAFACVMIAAWRITYPPNER